MDSNVNKEIKVEEEEEEEEYPLSITQTFGFTFNFPKETMGFVEITPGLFILRFPEREDGVAITSLHKISNFFLNKKMIFSTQWLPIYSFEDFYKIQRMYTLINNELLKYFDNYNWISDTTNNFDTLVTVIECSKLYSIYCFEDKDKLSLEILIKNSQAIKKPPLPINVQIFIGNNKIIDFNNDFQNLPNEQIYYVLLYFFRKLLHY